MRMSDWSSDVCSSDLGTEGGAIWKRHADGTGTPVRLTRDGAYYRDPAWSPDGRRLVSLRMPRHDFLVQHADRAMSGANAGDRDDGQKSPDADADAAASAGPELVWIDACERGEQIIGRDGGLTPPPFGPDRNSILFLRTRGEQPWRGGV